MKKKKVIYFFGGITNENVRALIEEVGEHENVTLYFNSEGGYIPDAMIMIDFVNSFQGNIEIVAIHDVSSSAFLIFLLAKCKKRILPATGAVVHEIGISGHTREVKIYPGLGLSVRNVDGLNRVLEELVYSKILTEEEMGEFKKGRDIAFDRKRLSEVVGKFGYDDIGRVWERLLEI